MKNHTLFDFNIFYVWVNKTIFANISKAYIISAKLGIIFAIKFRYPDLSTKEAKCYLLSLAYLLDAV